MDMVYKMKTCQILPWFPSENPTTPEARQTPFVYRQAMELSKRGHELKIITVKWPGQIDHEKINNVDIYRIPSLFTFKTIRYPIPNFFMLTNMIKKITYEWDPDVVVFAHVIFLTSLPSLFLKNKLKKPIIATTDVYPGINWFFGSNIVDIMGFIYTKIIVRRILRNAHGIQFLSSGLYEYSKMLGIDSTKAFVITTGVDIEAYKPRSNIPLRKELGIQNHEIVILFVGRMDLVKGVNYLLNAAARVIKKCNNVKFVLVGDGSLIGEYREYARPYADKIIFTGYRKDIPDLMNMADIFILPSLSEGAPNVIMEASASGMPVIASKVGEIPEMVLNDRTGILTPPKDVDAMTNALSRLIEDTDMARRMGDTGRKIMVENYSWDIICKKIEDEYQKVIYRYSNDGDKR